MKNQLAVVALMGTLLSGCAGFGMGGMSADQITAAAKDKSSAVGCTSYTGTGGQFQAMFVNNDQTFHTGGGETTVKCGSAEVTFKDAGNVVKPAAIVVPK